MTTDLYLFPPLKGITFQDVKDIKKNVTAKLNAVRLDACNDRSLGSGPSTSLFDIRCVSYFQDACEASVD